MKFFIKQLKQRHLFQAATVYAVTAWPAIQIADLAVPALQLPDSVMTQLLVAFAAGFPIALIFAWLFNITTEGVKLASAEGLSKQEQARTTSRMNIAISGSVLVMVSSVIMYQVLFGEHQQLAEQQDAPEVRPPGAMTQVNSKSIAVLPFVPFSQDIEDQYFADGMVEELLNVLARLDGLHVAARTSSFSYRNVTNKSIAEIGRELGVATILEGSVRKNDVTNTVRVTAQLINAVSGEHIWSETYDREYLDVFRIQDEIATAVGSKLKGTLLGAEEMAELKSETRNVDAMIAYGKGTTELAHRTADSITKAIGFFEESIRLDPDYARAYVGVADGKLLLALYGDLSEEQARADAAEAIDRAMELDPKLAAAWASRGLMLSDTDPKEAERVLLRAIELNPNYAMAHMWYASLLDRRGDRLQAQEYYENAYQLDPKSPVAAYNVAWGFYQQGSEARAMEVFSNIIASDPYYPGAYTLVGYIVSDRGRLDEAIDMYQRALDVDPTNKSAAKGMIMAHIDLGDFEGAERWFAYVDEQQVGLPAAYLLKLRAMSLLAQGDLEGARGSLQQVLASEPTGKMSNDIRADLAYYDHNYSQAIIAYEVVRQEATAMEVPFVRYRDKTPAFHLAYSYQALGRRQEAEELIAALAAEVAAVNDRQKNRWGYYYDMARVMALKGRADDALVYLQGAIDAGWSRTWAARIEPYFEPLNEHPRFEQMVGGVKARLSNMRNRLQSDGFDDDEGGLRLSQEFD